MSELSEAEASALRWLREARSTLISYIPDKPATDAFGDSVPHMAVFRRLEKKRLCFQTLEDPVRFTRSEEHTSELQSLMRISYAVFCLKKKNNMNTHSHIHCIP